jgi:hypothetical protein
MADRNALGLIGLMLGAATMFVVSVGAVVVTDHLSGRLTLVDSAQAMQTAALSSKAR